MTKGPNLIKNGQVEQISVPIIASDIGIFYHNKEELICWKQMLTGTFYKPSYNL